MALQQQTRTAWDEVAAGYDEFVTPTHKPLATQVLRRAGLQAGMQFLDVACGSGALSIPAAQLGATVTSVDISPRMIERLKARAASEGISNLEGRVMDGHALEFQDNTFDVSGSQFGVMLFPDMPLGVREMTRVTRRGGRVVVAAYGSPREVEFLGFFLDAVAACVPGFTGLPTDPPPLPFQLRDPSRLRDELSNAGLTQVQVETTREQLQFESAQQMWDWLQSSNPIGAALIADIPDDRKDAVQHVLGERLRERSGGQGPAVLNNPVHIGVGTK